MSGEAAAPAPAPAAPVRPLEGLTVVSVEQYGAAPFGTMYLADLGADVIKIENHRAGGEMGRHVLPYADGRRQPLLPDLQLQQALSSRSTSRGRADGRFSRSSPEARRRPRQQPAGRPAGHARARPCEPRRRSNPRLVCVHLSAYGRDNERAAWPGLDYVMQAEAGYLSMTGEPDSRAHPLRPLRRRLHGRADRGAGARLGRHAGAGHWAGHGHRHARSTTWR